MHLCCSHMTKDTFSHDLANLSSDFKNTTLEKQAEFSFHEMNSSNNCNCMFKWLESHKKIFTIKLIKNLKKKTKKLLTQGSPVSEMKFLSLKEYLCL